MTPPARDDKPSIADLELTPKQLETARLPYDSRQVVLARGRHRGRRTPSRCPARSLGLFPEPQTPLTSPSAELHAIRRQGDAGTARQNREGPRGGDTHYGGRADNGQFRLRTPQGIAGFSRPPRGTTRRPCDRPVPLSRVLPWSGRRFAYRHVLVDEAQDINGPRRSHQIVLSVTEAASRSSRTRTRRSTTTFSSRMRSRSRRASNPCSSGYTGKCVRTGSKARTVMSGGCWAW